MKSISKREMQVAELLAWGFSDKQVANELFVSFDTARSHRRNIYLKLECNNVADLTRWYFQETQNYNFGLKPQLRVALSVLFILLAISIEFFHLNAMRVKTVRTRVAKEMNVGRAKRNRKNLTFEYI